MIREPMEGRDDLGIPGDPGPSLPEPDGGTEVDRRDALADRVEDGPVVGGQPDVLPDVEVPEHHM